MNTTVACVMGLCRQVATHDHNVRQLAPLRILETPVSDRRSVHTVYYTESGHPQNRGFPRLPCFADSSADAIRYMNPVLHMSSALVAN